MNLPTLIVLILVAAAIFLAVWLPRHAGRKLTDCGSCSACKGCKGCPLQSTSLLRSRKR